MTLAFTEFTNNVATDGTTFAVTGSGIFDNMMETITAHIKSQYTAGAISNVDYANVYLGAMQAAIQTSAKIYLETQIQIDQSAMLQSQKLLVDKQVEETTSKITLDTKQGVLIDKQVEQGSSKIAIETKQGLLVDKQVEEGSSKISLDTKQGLMIDKQIEEGTAKIALTGKQGLLVDKQVLEGAAKITLLGSQNLLMQSQKVTEDKKDDLIVAQTLGFKVDSKQKVLAKALETWAIYYSVIKTGDPPSTTVEANTKNLYNSIMTDVGGTAIP
jgi:hypothetical protein